MQIINKQTGVPYEVSEAQAQKIKTSAIGRFYDIPEVKKAEKVTGKPLTEKQKPDQVEIPPNQA